MIRRKGSTELRRRLLLAVSRAYRSHADSTMQREDAAAELGLDLPTFLAALGDARQLGLLDPNE